MATGARVGVGERFGPFTVAHHLKSGGMGAVYVARTDEGAEVALKVLAGASDAARERFARECQIVRRIEHPNVIKTLGVGEQGDVAWLAMELLAGVDLEVRLTEGRVPPGEVVRVAVEACGALEAAHALRIIHRDIKPANLFLVGDAGHVKVLDFGIARSLDEATMTRTGSVLGTVSYMAPEQARGECDIDPRADVWSLGVVLYECLAGQVPFTAATLAGVLFQIITAPAAELHARRPDLPAALCRAVMRALEKRREARYPSAAAFADALRAANQTSTGELYSAARHGASVDAVGVTTLISAAGAAVTMDLRLVTVVFLRGVRDLALLCDLARRYLGELVPLRGDAALVAFGADVWFGDEPRRALRLARAARVVARVTSVATGKAAKSDGNLQGEAVDAAVAAATHEGCFIDRATSELAGASVDDTAVEEGRPAEAPFVGRDLELAMLAQAVDDAAAQRRAFAVIMVGVEGIGKTRALTQARAALRARDDVACLLVSCEAHQRDVPLAALRGALEAGASPELAALFDEPARGADVQAALDLARGRFVDLLADLTRDKAFVVAFDDAQWLDATTLALLQRLADTAEQLPIALWVFTRPEGRDALRELFPDATVREVAPLSRPQSVALLDAVAGGHPEGILERAGGHPLFLEQLGALYARGRDLVETQSPLPLSVQGAVLAQLDRLPPLERECVRIAAVVGDAAWLEAVTALGGDPGALASLRRAGVLQQRPRSRIAGCTEVAFRSQVVREVAYDMIPAPRRVALHHAVGLWLDARGGASAELALHWSRAGEDERAAAAFAEAAREAARVGDARAVQAHAEAALSRTTQPEVRWRSLIALDDVLQLGADREAQRRGLEELEGLAWGLSAAHRADVARRRAFAARLAGEALLAEAQGTKAIELAVACGDDGIGAAARVELALLCADQGRPSEALAHARDAEARARRVGSSWLVARAEATLGYVFAESGDLESARSTLDAAAAGFRRAGDPRRAAVVGVNAVAVLARIGRLALAEEAAAAALDAATRAGTRPAAAIATHNLGLIRRLRGDLASARRMQARALEEAEALRHVRLASAAETERAYLALALPPPRDEARALAARVLAAGEAARAPSLLLSARAASARLLHVVGGGSSARNAELETAAATARDLPRVEVCAAIAHLNPSEDTIARLAEAVEQALVHVPEVDRGVARTACIRRVRAESFLPNG